MAKFSRMDSALTVSPLATLMRGKIEWAFPANTWDDLYGEHEGRGYSRKLTMAMMADLMLQVIGGVRGSVFAAFRSDQESATPRIVASVQAVYGKLGRIDPDFSCKLVRYSSERFTQLLTVDHQPQVPGWAGYSIQIVDGTQPDGSEHRLGVLRTRKAAGLPCKFVVQYDLATGMCVDAVAAADAYTSEQVLAGDLFERAKAGDLFVADRHYALAKWFVILQSRRAYFVFRECSLQLALHEDGPRKRLGRTETGIAYEQPVEALDKTGNRWLPLRMIVIVLDTPTASGDREIRLLTNLPSKVNGKKIAGLYRQRWTIEIFQPQYAGSEEEAYTCTFAYNFSGGVDGGGTVVSRAPRRLAAWRRPMSAKKRSVAPPRAEQPCRWSLPPGSDCRRRRSAKWSGCWLAG